MSEKNDSQPATKKDLRQFAQEIITTLRGEMQTQGEGIVKQLRGEMQTQGDSLRRGVTEELRSDMAAQETRIIQATSDLISDSATEILSAIAEEHVPLAEQVSRHETRIRTLERHR